MFPSHTGMLVVVMTVLLGVVVMLPTAHGARNIRTDGSGLGLIIEAGGDLTLTAATTRMDGKLGVGFAAQTAGSRLSVNGGMAIGASYIGSTEVTNGLIVEGNVGIGTASPTESLDVVGNLAVSGTVDGVDLAAMVAATAARHAATLMVGSGGSAAGAVVSGAPLGFPVKYTSVVLGAANYSPGTGVYTSPLAGIYHVCAGIVFVPMAANLSYELRVSDVALTGTRLRKLCNMGAANGNACSTCGLIKVTTAGETFVVNTLQNTGTSLTLDGDGTLGFFHVHYLHA